MKWGIGIIVVLVILGGGYALIKHKSPSSPTASSQTSGTSASSSSNTSMSMSKSSPMNMTITANDSSATPETITAAAGQTVNLTFKVSSDGTYHGGLDFKSSDPAIDSGSIATGDSKTVQFVASKSFKFTPFWYESGVQKDYFVTVNVE